MHEFSSFAARLRDFIRKPDSADDAFNALALELFSLQYAANPVLRRLADHRRRAPENVEHWREIPAVPTSAFKGFDVTCLPPTGRARVFHSSGTSGQEPSRHFHSYESLALYEASLLPWFERHVLATRPSRLLAFTSTGAAAPHSSLVHMFETVARSFLVGRATFAGRVVGPGGAWELDFDAANAAFNSPEPLLVVGTAFNFVHLLDEMSARGVRFKLPAGSVVMETGGYKGRSRVVPKLELHRQIGATLGLGPEAVVTEYGMSELSSQAYDSVAGQGGERFFRFPPWARAVVTSPETGAEVADGETGLLRIFDLANAWSTLAVQTEDLAVRVGDVFTLVGRAAAAEPRGCSLQAA